MEDLCLEVSNCSCCLYFLGDCMIVQCPTDLNAPLAGDIGIDSFCEADNNAAGILIIRD